jgi:hypothetical protein
MSLCKTSLKSEETKQAVLIASIASDAASGERFLLRKDCQCCILTGETKLNTSNSKRRFKALSRLQKLFPGTAIEPKAASGRFLHLY